MRALLVVLVATACGRLGLTDANHGGDAGSSDGAAVDAPPRPAAFVRSTAEMCNVGMLCGVASTQVDAGDVVLVVITYTNTTGHVMSVADDAANVYTNLVPSTSWPSMMYSTELWAATGAHAAAPLSVTATFSQSMASSWVYVAEYNGSGVDQTAFGEGMGVTGSSGARTTAHPNEVVFGHGEGNGTTVFTGSGFTQRLSLYGNIEEDEPAPSVGPYDASFGLSPSGEYIAVMATIY